MGSSGSASVYCLKKFKENYLKDKERIDEELRDEYEIEIDLGDISDLSYKQIFHELFWNNHTVTFFNESLVLCGSTYDNDDIIDGICILDEAGAEVASTTIY
jgi:hypothetical protein